MMSNLHNYDPYDDDDEPTDSPNMSTNRKEHELYHINNNNTTSNNKSTDNSDDDDDKGHNYEGGVNDSTMSYESTAAEELEATKQHTIPYSNLKTTASSTSKKLIQRSAVTHSHTSTGVDASATDNISDNNIDGIRDSSSGRDSSSMEDKVFRSVLGQFIRPLTQTFDRYCRGRKLPRITAGEMRGGYIL